MTPAIRLNTLQIVGIAVAHLLAHILYIDKDVTQQFFCPRHTILREIDNKILVKTLLENLAEIGVGIVHGLCHRLQRNIIHIIVFNKRLNIPGNRLQPDS